MTALVTEQGIVHYQAYGRGRPVILLHGWLGSWALWRQSIEVLGQGYRTYALDFFGFGESGGTQAEMFTVENYVSLVRQFMERQGIVRAALVGHSMGGTVALSAAMRYPEQVVKVIVIGSPMQGTSLNPLLKLSGNPAFANLLFSAPPLLHGFLRTYSLFMARDGVALGRMITEDVSKISADSFFQSIRTLRHTDLRDRLNQVQMPVLGIYGPNDIIVDPQQSRVLRAAVPHSKLAWFKQSGHFPMLDEPERFYRVVKHFLDEPVPAAPSAPAQVMQ